MLTGRLLVPPRDHQTHVDVVTHPVALHRLPQCSRDLVAVHADVEADRGSVAQEPVEVEVEEGELTVVEPDALPDAVAHEVAAVEDRDPCLLPREELPVDIDEDVVVARVGDGGMGGHGGESSQSSEDRRLTADRYLPKRRSLLVKSRIARRKSTRRNAGQ